VGSIKKKKGGYDCGPLGPANFLKSRAKIEEAGLGFRRCGIEVRKNPPKDLIR